MTKTLLLEIGAEELPSSFVDAALAAMPALLKTKLAGLRLSHGDVKALGTPRRLSVVVKDVAERQPDLDEEVIGPPETAAFKDGKPTKAAEAFAAKLGVPLEAISVVEKPASGKQKAGRYVVGRRQERGREARELLGKALAEICSEIPFRKSMRWGAGEATFGRPVQWLVALLGSDLIDVAFAGQRAGRLSRGHRFLAAGTVEIPNADAYVDTMRSRHVLVDREERARTMMDRVAEAAKAVGGFHDPVTHLVDENASLVEEPHVVTGSFDPAYLTLPPAVIRAVSRGHQKYFCVETTDAILPHYLAVVNTALDPARIVKGNDRVMTARLSDAKFFFEEDKKAKLDDRAKKLGGIVFHNRLGTVGEKTVRMKTLALAIAKALGMPEKDHPLVARAAELAKVDLVSLMVGEFPELQGDMGRAYALVAGENPRVADAIRDHYCPIGADGAVAPDDVAACVALADRLDTLAGCFAVGLSPTGTADPFALRRACIATLRTMLDRSRVNAAYGELSLETLFGVAWDGFDGKKLDLSREDTVKKVMDFTHERLRGLVASATSNAVADAVCVTADSSPVRVLSRATAVHRAVLDGRAWLEKARTVAKRLSGISKDSAPVFHAASTFEKEDDARIVEVVSRVDAATKDLRTEAQVTAALAQAEDLAQRLDDVFTRTLVNDPNDPRTRQRLELLSYGARSMMRIGDFSKLS